MLRKIVFIVGEDKFIATRSARIFWVSFWLIFLVIVTIYSGNLVACLATQHIKLPFTSIDELAEDTTYQITISQRSSHQTLLQVKSISPLFFCKKEFDIKSFVLHTVSFKLTQVKKNALCCTVPSHVISQSENSKYDQ